MEYVDGFVAAVPTARKDAYRPHAGVVATVFRENGALSVMECWGDDVPDGKTTSFPMAVKKEDDETVVFSWVVWPSREARVAGWEKCMSDPRMAAEENAMPMDGKGVIHGGFEVILNK